MTSHNERTQKGGIPSRSLAVGIESVTQNLAKWTSDMLGRNFSHDLSGNTG